MRAALLLSVITACGGSGASPDQDAAVAVDSSPEPDAPPPPMVCAGQPDGLLPGTCFPPPMDAVTFGTEIFDTNFNPRCDAVSTTFCIVVASSITIDGTLRAVGPKPLVLWAATTITVSAAGSIDASARVGVAFAAAGSNAADCDATGASFDTNTTPMFASGGHGGSFGSRGGAGGEGRLASGVTLANNLARSPRPLALRGGCAGGQGGEGPAGGTAGFSGGALYLIAGSSIDVAGVIHANGAGGGGSSGAPAARFGGGGGGSGGLIGLDAPTVAVSGRLFALGGAGGSGSATFNGIAIGGTDGADPASEPTARALGGAASTGNNAGGDGGGLDGSDGLDAGSVVMPNEGGGGGGGGGAGRIAVFATTSDIMATATILPPLSN